MNEQDKFDQWVTQWADTFEEYGPQTILLWEINKSLKIIATRTEVK